MVDRHCPFLNRDDPRCAKHFQVNHLDHAFEHCAGAYSTCPSYREMLAERIMRRVSDGTRVSLSVGGRIHEVDRCRPPVADVPVAAPTYLTVARRPRAWSVTARGLVESGSLIESRGLVGAAA